MHSLLHAVNGFICAGVGFGLTDILNRSERVKLSLSPMFVCLFSFCFSMTVGVVWEFFEFGADMLFEKIRENPFFTDIDDFNGGTLCREMLDEAFFLNGAYDERIRALVTAVMISICRKMNSTGESRTNSAKISKPSLMRKLDTYLRNFREDITCEKIAGELYISQRQLSRIMNNVYGMSFSKKVISLRLEYARELLKSGSLSIEKVAEQSGFSSSGSFCKNFKAAEGCSPTQYRKEASGRKRQQHNENSRPD